MKKLFFVLVFTFIGQQVFSQIYTLTTGLESTQGGCPNPTDFPLLKTDPNGNETVVCLASNRVDFGSLGSLTAEVNQIINLGYKLIHTFTAKSEEFNDNGLIYQDFNSSNGATVLSYRTTFIFAIPWSASGIEEVTTTLKRIIISPNPANEFVNIILSYGLKGESEIIFISEAGYVYHKESIDNISKNETYNIEISKIPEGKYLVTIKNGKTYTTPQKLIIL